jgi:hypothetical protein
MNIEKIANDLKLYQEELNKLEISIEQILHQLEIFSRGIPFTEIIRPCRIDDGIFVIDHKMYARLIEYHKLAASTGRLMKFVPASGAATRMFSDLQSYINNSDFFSNSSLKEKAGTENSAKSVYDFIVNIRKFAFYDKLTKFLEEDKVDPENLDDVRTISSIIRKLLGPDGLNYSFYPKGVILFHKYAEEARTAFEEHLYESVDLVADQSGNVRIHFTISEEHTDIFLKSTKKTIYELKKKNFLIEAAFSYQKKSTNTISVTNDNELFVDSNNKLVFRPAGHGALIENLNDIDGDIILIKNIDNILPATKNKKSIKYTSIMTGFLISVQREIFSYLRLLEQKKINEGLVTEIKKFAIEYLSIHFPENFDKWITDVKASFLFDKLNRPLRVCGMVKNEGHPGGGPFWVKDSKNEVSIQIVEAAQVNQADSDQLKLLKKATHFNPVDMVCAVRDYNGKKFNLKDYVDENSSLITIKTHEGKPLKALELPGLWNGGMAFWNTVFIEIPVDTFNPVKEINDLLRDSHQVEI